MHERHRACAACTFIGDVDARFIGRPGPDLVIEWTCPDCGHEYREEPE